MTDRPEVAPALTPEEWEDFETGFFGGVQSTDVNNASQSDRVYDIAIINASLPDDSPYKITRADVAIAEAVAHLLYGLANEDGNMRGIAVGAPPLIKLAAKLAAILPPEPQ